MGSCFSKRKRSDAAVIHNASPRSSFSLSCKGDAITAPSPLRAHKPSDEIVVVLTKDSAPLLANTQNAISLKKSKSKKSLLSAQQVENAKPQTEEKCSVLQGNSVVNCDIVSSVCQDSSKALPISHSHEAPIDKYLQCSRSYEASALASKPQMSGVDSVEHFASTRSVNWVDEFVDNKADGGKAEDKEMLLSIDDEFVMEVDEMGSVGAKLKRSRSCEEAVHATETQRPLRRRSFQETSTFSPRTSKLETIPEPHFGTTKYLEGLDLVDVLPYKSSQHDAQTAAWHGVKGELRPTVLDLPRQESNGLSADFFALKDRYLSSCSAALQEASLGNACLHADDGMMSPRDICPEADDGTMRRFGRMHSRASSMDSAEHMDMMNLFPSCRHPISAVEEEDEDEGASDDSETFEFKQAVSVYTHTQNQKNAELRSRETKEGAEIEGANVCRFKEGNEVCRVTEGNGKGRYKELSVVATGDALLYTGSNSEEFDLIPSKSYVRGSPKNISNSNSAMVASDQSTYYKNQKGLDDDDEEKQQQSSLSVEDIIYLLEREELDEEVLLSFLNLARSTTTSHGGNTPSCHASSEVASEASFEFKVKSSGSTPHSTPSTPMLSAGSTPKRITQLSPLVLTPEEIAEIWGVFEQRQALSPFQM